MRAKRGKYRSLITLKTSSAYVKTDQEFEPVEKNKEKLANIIIVLIDLAVLQSVTLLVCGTYLQWWSEEKPFHNNV